MKKLTKIILALLTVFSISACNEKKEEKPLTIKWHEENKIDNAISYSLETISTTKRITPDVIDESYTYYKPSKASNVLLDVVLNVTNHTKKELDLKKYLNAFIVAGKDNYAALLATVSDEKTALSQEVKIAAKATKKVHAYVEINPKKLDKKVEFKLVTNDKENPQTAKIKFEAAKINKNYENINLNDTMIFDNHGEITLQSSNIAKELQPSNPNGLYKYYKVKNTTDSFIILNGVIKNNSDSDLKASDIACLKLIDKNNNEYPVSIYCENEEQSDFISGLTKTISANQSSNVYFVFELSDEVINDQKTIRISYQGKVYTINI